MLLLGSGGAAWGGVGWGGVAWRRLGQPEEASCKLHVGGWENHMRLKDSRFADTASPIQKSEGGAAGGVTLPSLPMTSQSGM